MMVGSAHHIFAKVGGRGRPPYQGRANTRFAPTGNWQLFFKKGVAGKIWYGNIVWLDRGAKELRWLRAGSGREAGRGLAGRSL